MPNIPETWRDPFIVNTTTASSRFGPDITQLANGNILVSWTAIDPDSPGGDFRPNEIFGQILDPLGNKVGAELRLSNVERGASEEAGQLAALPGGGFVVIFREQFQSSSNVRLEEYDANGNPLPAQGFGPAGNPRLAASSDTSVLVVYTQNFPDQSPDPEDPDDLDQFNTLTRGEIYTPTTDTYSFSSVYFGPPPDDIEGASPDVAVLTNGNYVVTADLSGPDSGREAIGYQIVDNSGETVRAPGEVPGSESNAFAFGGRVAALAGGGFVIAWNGVGGFSIHDAAGTQLSSGALPGGVSDVIGLADGNFVIRSGDMLTHFSATGLNLGSREVDFSPASTASLGDGRFAVVGVDSAGEITMQILDTRDTANTPGVYAPDPWQIGTIGDDTFAIAAGTIFTTGHDGNDTIAGNGGDNVITGGAGNDSLDGGAGSDTADYADAPSGVTVSLAAPGAQNTGGRGVDTLTRIENVFGSAFADTLTGNGGDNRLRGGAGNDSLDGGGGNDTADYADAAAGVTVSLAAPGVQNTRGAGADTLTRIENVFGSAFADTLGGNAGNNRLDGGAGDDRLGGGAGIDSLDGGAGIDTADYAGAAAGVTVNLAVTVAQNTGGSGNDTLSGIENVRGSAFADTLTGDSEDNRLRGGGGNDSLDGGGGNDTADYADAAAGVTVNLALPGAQNTGGSGNDTLTRIENVLGSAFADALTGNGGDNLLDSGAGNDSLDGGDGDDSLDGGAGNDTFDGGAGIDTADYEAATAGVTVNLAAAGAQNTGGSGFDSWTGTENVLGSALADTLTGNGANNLLRGGAGNDSLAGGAGNDILAAGAGDDSLNGGAGIDTVDYSDATAGVRVILTSTDPQSPGGGGQDRLTNIERVFGSNFTDVISGTSQDNVIKGGDGYDELFGLGGNDILEGGAGGGRLDGGDGNDILDGGGSGHLLRGEAGNDTLRNGAGNDTLDGGDGIDTADYGAATSGVTVNLNQVTQSTGGGGFDLLSDIEHLLGSAFADTLLGNDAGNRLTGGGGDDTLVGRAGRDTLDGGAGNDRLDGGIGIDTADYAGATAGVTINTAVTGAQDTGGSGIDTLTGIERVFGSAFADTLRGAAGNETLSGAAGMDLIYGGGGNDTIDGGAGIDRLIGVTGDDLIFGGADADSLIGGPGLDRLDGGAGMDRLYADASTADTFVFTSAAGIDRVFGFVSGLHNLEIDASAFGGVAGSFVFRANANPVAPSATRAFLYDTAGVDAGKLWFDADGNGAGARVHVLTLLGAPTLAAADIELM